MINTYTISFLISILCIVGMIYLKFYEIKTNKKSLLSLLAENTDHIFERIVKDIKFVILHVNKHNAIALVQWIAYHILSWIRGLYIKIKNRAHAHPHSKKVIDMLSGKCKIERNGGVSFYLKKISEEGNMRKSV